MTCQHTLFGSPADSRIGLERWEARESGAILFRPIVDTFAHRVLGHECVIRPLETPAPDPLQACLLMVQAAAAQNPHGLYFIPLIARASGYSEPDLLFIRTAAAEAGLTAANIALDIADSELARDWSRLLRIREQVREWGFALSLSVTGVAARSDSLDAVRDFAPEYVRVDRNLIRSIDRPAAGATVSHLSRLAERSHACLIAGGVDRIRVLENVWLLGVQYMQGDLFGRPSPLPV